MTEAQGGVQPGLVDSHCHLDFPEFEGKIDVVQAEMREHGVSHALCISVDFEAAAKARALALAYPNFYASVGVHPEHEGAGAPSCEQIVEWAREPRVIAIGETGLDYYRSTGDLEWQRERFRTHVRAARRCGKSLVIHTREAAEDTLRIMREEDAGEVGGVMHCFTETQAVADAAMAMGFAISFSGIVTFKNAVALREIARRVPLDSLLVETDSPFLAPVPHRGKPNRPAWVRFVAEEVARLRGISVEALAEATTVNFRRIFSPPKWR